MKKSILAVMTVCIFAVSTGLAGITVDISTPLLDEDNPLVSVVPQALIDILNTQLAADAATLETETETLLSKYGDTPDLALGFANANAYSAHAATQRFVKPGKLVVTLGSMIGVHAPSMDPSYYNDIDSDLDAGDIEAGVSINPIAIQVGMNADMIMPGLFAGLKLGKMKLELDTDKVKITSNITNIGVVASYPLLKGKSLGVVGWNGVSVGTGLIYQSGRYKFYKDLDPIAASSTLSFAGYTGYVEVDPSIAINIESTAVIIPIEVMTSVKLLAFNIAVGAGMDLAFGSSEIEVEAAGTAVVKGDLGALTAPGALTVNATTDGDGPETRMKLMLDIGTKLGPVMLDFPITFHLSNGASIGLTAGVRL